MDICETYQEMMRLASNAPTLRHFSLNKVFFGFGCDNFAGLGETIKLFKGFFDNFGSRRLRVYSRLTKQTLIHK